MNNKGMTLIEVMVVIVIVAIAGAMVTNVFLNNRGATERRAYQGAANFISMNNITPKRLTCSGDSDSDGYGTCVIMTSDDQRIMLECPTNYFDVNVFGASSCKEVFGDVNLTLR